VEIQNCLGKNCKRVGGFQVMGDLRYQWKLPEEDSMKVQTAPGEARRINSWKKGQGKNDTDSPPARAFGAVKGRDGGSVIREGDVA